MLTADPKTRALTATCDVCHVTRGELGADRGDAERVLIIAGWLDMPRKGVGRERCAWHCPACAPRDARGSLGASTGDMKRAK